MLVIDGALDMAVTNTTDLGFKIAIVGDSGSGKSWLAASCASEEEPAYHFDFDQRRQSIAGKPHITSKTYFDSNYPNLMPTAWPSFLTDLMAMETAKERKELPWKWFIYDSATFGSIACLNYIMYNTPSMRREVKAAGSTTYIPKSFDTYKAEINDVISAWSRLICLGNLIVTFHMDPERAQDSTAENPKFTGNLGVTPPRYNDLLALFNDQWRVKPTGEKKYEVMTQPQYDMKGFFVAKSTLQIDATETPDIRAMLAKHMSKTRKP